MGFNSVFKGLMFIIIPTYSQISSEKPNINFTLLICAYVDIEINICFLTR